MVFPGVNLSSRISILAEDEEISSRAKAILGLGGRNHHTHDQDPNFSRSS